MPIWREVVHLRFSGCVWQICARSPSNLLLSISSLYRPETRWPDVCKSILKAKVLQTGRTVAFLTPECAARPWLYDVRGRWLWEEEQGRKSSILLLLILPWGSMDITTSLLYHCYIITLSWWIWKCLHCTSTSFRKSSSRSLRKPQVQSDNSKDKLAPGILCLADSMVLRVDSPIGKCVHEQGLVRNVKDRAALAAVTTR